MPELFDIVGQDTALAQLQRAVARRRQPHAYIFAGPEGVGRQTTAVEFAKLLLCQEPATTANRGGLAELPQDFPLRVACGKCASCRTARAGTNPDLQLVHKELARYHDDPKVRDRVMQDLGVDVIRQFLIAPASRASAGGRGRTFIVRQAELMSTPAQNALLKTLEEPPGGVTIILLCSDPGALLPTTRSRCQTIRFSPLALDFVAKTLAQAGVAEEEARFLAALTAGSLGLAGSLAGRLAGEGLYQLKRRLVDLLSAVSAGKEAPLAEMLTEAMDLRAKALRKADADLAPTLASRQAGQTILALTASVYRDALAVACSARRPLVHADQARPVSTIAGRFGPEALAEILAQLARYEQLLWRNVNPKLLWDNVAITCASAAALEV